MSSAPSCIGRPSRSSPSTRPMLGMGRADVKPRSVPNKDFLLSLAEREQGSERTVASPVSKQVGNRPVQEVPCFALDGGLVEDRRAEQLVGPQAAPKPRDTRSA